MKRLGMIMAAMIALTSIPALAEVKVGYVDLQRAIEGTSTGKKARAELEKEFKAKKKDLEKKEKDLKKMTEDFEKKKLVLSDDVKRRKEVELQQEILKFRKLVQESELNIRKREQQLTKPIVEKLQKAVAEVAKTKKVGMVLNQNKNFRTVLWASDEVDLTDEVIKRYEKMK